MRWMTWQASGLPDIARHVIGRHSTPETRVQKALDDAASNIWRARPARWTSPRCTGGSTACAPSRTPRARGSPSSASRLNLMSLLVTDRLTPPSAFQKITCLRGAGEWTRVSPCHARDALDLRLRVDHGVEPRALALLAGAHTPPPFGLNLSTSEGHAGWFQCM